MSASVVDRVNSVGCVRAIRQPGTCREPGISRLTAHAPVGRLGGLYLVLYAHLLDVRPPARRVCPGGVAVDRTDTRRRHGKTDNVCRFPEVAGESAHPRRDIVRARRGKRPVTTRDHRTTSRVASRPVLSAPPTTVW